MNQLTVNPLVKALKIMLTAFLGLVLALAALLCWVIFTESGTRQLFSTFARYELLAYQNLEGSISKQLAIQKLSIYTSSAEVTISELSLTADWSELLYSRVQFQELSAQRVDIYLSNAAVNTSPDNVLSLDFLDDRQVFMPLEILLRKLSIHELNINRDEQQFNLHDIQLTSLLNQQGISDTHLNLRYEKTIMQLQGKLAMAPRLAVDLKLHWNSVLSDLSSLAGTAQISGSTKEFSIHHSSSGDLVSDVHIKLTNWRKEPHLVLQGTAAKLSWPLTNTTPPQLTDVVFSANGDLSALRTKVQARMLLNNQSSSRLELASIISKDKLDISKLRITDDHDGYAEITGQLNWLDNRPKWQAQATLQQFDGSSLHPLLPQKLLGSLHIDGNYNKKLALNIVTHNLQGELRTRPFDASINAQLKDDNLQVQHLQAHIGSNQLTLSGQLNKSSLNIKLNTHLIDLEQILLPAKGSIIANGLLTGTPQHPTLKAQVEAEQLKLFNVAASHVKLSIDLENGVFMKGANHLTANNLRYQTMQLETLSITSQGHWQAPTLWLDTLNPLLQVNLETSLQLADLEQIEGQLEQLRVQGDSLGDWQLEMPVNYHIGARGWSLTGLCLQSNGGQACVQASSEAAQLRTKLRGQQIPLQLLNAAALLDTGITGTLDIDATLSGDLKQNQGQLYIKQSNTDEPIVLTATDGTTQIRIDGLSSNSTLNNGVLKGSLNARLNGDGSLDSEFEVKKLLSELSPLKAQFDYKIPDLKPYALLIPEVDDLEGKLEGSIKLSNSLQKPQLWLFTRLHVPQIYISPLAIEWRNLTAEITTPSVNKQEIKATVEAGDGHLALSGSLSFISTNHWRSALHLSGDNALLMDQANRRVIASPDIKIVATADNLDAQGVLRIPEAMLNIKPSPDRLSLTDDAVIHTQQETEIKRHSPYRFNIDLAVLLADKVNFQAYGLNTNVMGKLVLTKQSPGALFGNGELNLVNGAYQAYGQDLTIERGIISFSGGLSRPHIMLTANRTIKDIKAGLHVNGPVDNLRTQLYSEPAMQDSEILSYIIRGKPLKNASVADQNALANALLSYSISQSTPITSKLSELSGLDEIGIEAEEGIETLGFTLGKYITPRLYARYGIGIIDKLSKVFLQYQLTDKLYLETESGIGQSVDLMYRSR